MGKTGGVVQMSAILWFQTIVGIFSFIAFAMVTFFLKKNQLEIGPWILLSFATVCFTLGEYMRGIAGNDLWHDYLLTVAMIMLFLVAILKFWDIMELVQGY